ncbi:hypothetical protein CRU86_01040 [Aliarcobacter skirrowii]|uniref:Membrane protein n=1 Tax=Aliarcobacter skirrowii CCUG 10374 TaxID=1032239 RepID=A0AAD0WN16_9BACT|nr:hypothetical protein [Aliarcobacter skirrowii]AXX84448.1 putative membrane protein [Aliarcobacter skirrowii CCUG 10374]KAB0621379.1 hypothetical protein F7P70_00600 [Aliarcobacter skirrowii CCUG 10374]MDX4049829.1 hypothetical protein [Aliarcobacter skirrowii]RXI26635.1 hypothetical protein CP959_00600 [Aliarcobacter skirrowii CCUG 10374]RXJ80417.1 hypothetical protein CRU86_01040 [Aliarcobacter skirrowii]
MNNTILNRYDKDENGNLIIKIYTTKIEDLYEDYDKKSTFIKKDLKEDLENYLEESVAEIADNSFIINFNFDEKSGVETQNRLKVSIKEYFEYLQFLEKNKMRDNLRNSLIFISLGVVLIAISLIIPAQEKFILKILTEGVTVGAWVCLWEAMAIILVNWLPLKKRLKILKKISNAKIVCS